MLSDPYFQELVGNASFHKKFLTNGYVLLPQHTAHEKSALELEINKE